MTSSFSSNNTLDTSTEAVLVGVITRGVEEADVLASLDELERLLETAGGTALARMTQVKDSPDPRTYIGSGKVQELKELCVGNEISLVVFDEDLSPIQIRNLEKDLENDTVNIRVIDRSMLILDIFALHAVSAEGKLQVELAQLQYTAPRLTGKGAEMSRLGGGIGTRGPGESKLESDRRHMKRRIHALQTELEVVEKNRITMRAARDRSGIPKIAIIGYTNAGKSTLLNTLTGAGILAEDKLFATLDPTTRQFSLPNGEKVLLTDTVGFIRKLPHHLVKAFRSTLEEAVYADILLIVLDASDDAYERQLEVTEQLLEELGASGKPTLYVFNKCDRLPPDRLPARLQTAERDDVIYLSALTGEGCDRLCEALQRLVGSGKRRVTFVISNAEQGALSRLYSEETASVENVEYGNEAVTVTALVDNRVYGMLRKYDPDYQEPTEDY